MDTLSSRISFSSLRKLAKHTALTRRLGHDVRTASEATGFHRIYDVVILGRRLTLWAKDLDRTSGVTIYAITIDGRVRFLDRASMFHSASEAWDIITGIAYLGRYDNGSPVYGCEHPVEIVAASGPGLFPFNYSRPILVTDEHLQPDGFRFKNHHEPFGRRISQSAVLAA